MQKRAERKIHEHTQHEVIRNGMALWLSFNIKETSAADFKKCKFPFALSAPAQEHWKFSAHRIVSMPKLKWAKLNKSLRSKRYAPHPKCMCYAFYCCCSLCCTHTHTWKENRRNMPYDFRLLRHLFVWCVGVWHTYHNRENATFHCIQIRGTYTNTKPSYHHTCKTFAKATGKRIQPDILKRKLYMNPNNHFTC